MLALLFSCLTFSFPLPGNHKIIEHIAFKNGHVVIWLTSSSAQPARSQLHGRRLK